MDKLIRKILVANRGEIAVRILRTANRLGIATVAVYPETDREALHVARADESYALGAGPLSETYLNIEKLIRIAMQSGADAIHPGYGFLSENPAFAKACEDNGIIFIGPSSVSIEAIGNKIRSREIARELGIPVTTSFEGSVGDLEKKGKLLPYPVLIKAAAGGGGKGMKIVKSPGELKASLESAGREALNYFGDGTVYIEQYLEEPRHIEVQVIGDRHGNYIHLFERECTIQRRHQKIIEEAPSSITNYELRMTIWDAAITIARKIGYVNAGTVEFLVDRDGKFYFLEMNTRIQVE
ncbi:MAG TPA: biotin carboxylase N-terminal domain-containing protein, partial [Bacteroidales bacterium]|nr:biotin carboxylase N-terminal domain-containing protein [Bacteroidales bacterium]